jgi:hypothetical protein
MSDWGPRTYGDRCRECGFAWDCELSDALALVEGVVPRLHGLVDDAGGRERHSDLGWSVVGYVCHIGDNLRIWAERLAGITRGDAPVVGSYDDNQLAAARAYDTIGLAGAMWSLERAVRDWLEAVRAAPSGLTMNHPERGVIGLDDIVRSNTHDAMHHAWDITRTLQQD